jgi:hypothetical protein
MNHYEIRVKGQLDHQWSEWFEGLAISHDGEGNTILHGPLVDQAALQGVLMKIHDLALTLLAVNPIVPNREQRESPEA